MWVEFARTWEERSDRRSVLRAARWGEEIEMVVTGQFECGGGYGHENMYSCEFTIEAVEMILRRVPKRRAK